jgi:uncharacterized damage-inducible protein DinB
MPPPFFSAPPACPEPAERVAAAVRANLAVIRQGVALLGTLGGERYAARVAVAYGAAIGGHMRHIIEHYLGFLNGLPDGAVDYENRARDPLMETSPAYAADTLAAIADRIEELAANASAGAGDRALRIHAETSDGAAAGSSVLRELEFLLSHTVHHYALIAVMARLQGHEPAADFGVAPSTLKFQQRQQLAASA